MTHSYNCILISSCEFLINSILRPLRLFCLFMVNSLSGSVSSIFNGPVMDQASGQISTWVVMRVQIVSNMKLSLILSGFREGYGTQHASIKVTEEWRKRLDSSETLGTILIQLLIDLSTRYEWLPHHNKPIGEWI